MANELDYVNQEAENTAKFSQKRQRPKQNLSKRYFITTLLLSAFLGAFGIHNFYNGKIGAGFVQLISFGGFGLYTAKDFVDICFNVYRDADNLKLRNYNFTVGIIFFVLFLLSYLGIIAFIVGSFIEKVREVMPMLGIYPY